MKSNNISITLTILFLLLATYFVYDFDNQAKCKQSIPYCLYLSGEKKGPL